MLEYWRNNKELTHLTPPSNRWPEVGLFEALQSVCVGSVFEIGCGDGRLSPCFNYYVGYDINPYALKQAKLNNPHHQYVSEWQQADTILAYTVLLHIDDVEIKNVIAKMKAYPRIVIGEITGRKWRRNGNPPVYNREVKDYEHMLGIKADVIKVPYPHYNCDLDLMVFDAH